MFLQLNRPSDPFFRNHPCQQYRRVRPELEYLDELLVPAMHLLQHLNQPRIVTPKQPEGTDKNNFVVKVDVQQFSPEELSVKMVDNFLVIEGKHEEKEDDHGFVSRQFVRRYAVPENMKFENLTCNLSSDGVLVISAPLMIEEPQQKERSVPINFTGQPAVVDATPKATGDLVEQKVAEKVDAHAAA